MRRMDLSLKSLMSDLLKDRILIFASAFNLYLSQYHMCSCWKIPLYTLEKWEQKGNIWSLYYYKSSLTHWYAKIISGTPKKSHHTLRIMLSNVASIFKNLLPGNILKVHGDQSHVCDFPHSSYCTVSVCTLQIHYDTVNFIQFPPKTGKKKL